MNYQNHLYDDLKYYEEFLRIPIINDLKRNCIETLKDLLDTPYFVLVKIRNIGSKKKGEIFDFFSNQTWLQKEWENSKLHKSWGIEHPDINEKNLYKFLKLKRGAEKNKLYWENKILEYSNKIGAINNAFLYSREIEKKKEMK